MVNRPAVTIGFILEAGGNDGNIEEILYSISKQDYENLELLIVADDKDDTVIAGLIRQLYFLPVDLRKQTTIKLLAPDFCAGSAIQWCLNNASGEFIFFHAYDETLYDTSTISYCANLMICNESLNAIYMPVFVMRKSDGRYRIIKLEEKRASGADSVLRGAFFRRSAFEGQDVSGLQYGAAIEALALSIPQERILSVGERCSTRVYRDNLDDVDLGLNELTSHDGKSSGKTGRLNYSDYRLLERLAKIAKEACSGPGVRLGSFHNVERAKKKIKQEFEAVERLAETSVWGRTRSQKALTEYLYGIYYALLKPRHAKYIIDEIVSAAAENYEERIKLVFFVNEYAVWPSALSLYEASMNAQKYLPQVVFVPFSHASKTSSDEDEIEEYRKAGIELVAYNQYDIAEESPDVAVYLKPYDSIPSDFYIDQIHRIVRRCLYVPYGMEVGNNDECLGYQCHTQMQFYAWRIVAYSKGYYNKMVNRTYTHGQNCLPCGHPRTDLRFRDFSKTKLYERVKEKADGRLIVLWNTHFDIEENGSFGTFSSNGRGVLEYFKSHPETFLLWRPHPFFFGALAHLEGTDLGKVHSWIEAINSQDNVYVDESPSYLNALAVADAVVSDWSSLVPEVLAWGKPLLVTERKGNAIACALGLEDFFSKSANLSEIIAFIEGIDVSSPNQTSSKVMEQMYLEDDKVIGEWLIDYIRDCIDSGL